MDDNKKQIIRKNYSLLIFIIMLVVSFIALSIGLSLFLGTYKLDSTSQKIYTLSPQTVNLLKKNEENLYIKVYISPNLDSEYPLLSQYSKTVLRFLEQYKNHSNELLSLEVKEVIPYTASEKEAKDNNIRGFLDKSGQNNLYFGATIGDEYGNVYTIPYFEPSRQNYLEHDVTRLISKLGDYTPPVVGVISPVFGVMNSGQTFDTNTDWAFIEYLKNDYEVRHLTPTSPFIPFDIETLLLVNPQNISKVLLYAIDQFIMRGGNVMILLDPYSETALTRTGFSNPAPSGMSAFLKNIGVQYQEDVVVGDSSLGEKVLVSGEQNQVKSYPLWFTLNQSEINPDNPLTSGITALNFKSPGSLWIESSALAKAYPLFLTSEHGGQIDTKTVRRQDKFEILQDYRQTNQNYYLGWLLEGRFMSFFDAEDNSMGRTAKNYLPFMSTSINDSKLLLVADSDIIETTNWNLSSLSPEMSVYDFVPYNNNIDFIQKSVDYLTDNHLTFIGSKNKIERRNNIAQNIAAQNFEQQKETYAAISQKLQAAQAEKEHINKQLENNEIVYSVMIIKELEQLEREIATQQEALKQLNYQIKEQNTKDSKKIIILNSIVFPAIIIALITLLFWHFRRKDKKQAQRLINEQKDA